MGHGSGARECERVEGMRHVALVYGRGRRADIADLAVYHARAATEVGRPLLSALVATDPNPAIVHTVLIGIHCRPSDLFRRLPAECRARCPDTWEFLRVTRSPDHPSPPLSFSSHAGG